MQANTIQCCVLVLSITLEMNCWVGGGRLSIKRLLLLWVYVLLGLCCLMQLINRVKAMIR